jgi:hypothetical protein
MYRPDSNSELERLLHTSKPVPGTHPPVYMFDGGLIGFDKLEQLKIIARSQSEPVKIGWLLRILKALTKTVH